MKKHRILLTAFSMLTFITITFSGCKKDNKDQNCIQHALTNCSEDSTKTNLRIKNNSSYDFCNLVLNPSGGDVNCGIIEKGGTTCYRAFDLVYSYAYIQFFIGNKEFKLMPIDYVGEQPLGVGKFTYIIDITDFNSGLFSITVQQD